MLISSSRCASFFLFIVSLYLVRTSWINRTSLVTLVNSLDVGHMAMWPVSVNHMAMWTRLLTLVQVGDCWKYALEAIINWLLLYFLVHDNCLLFML